MSDKKVAFSFTIFAEPLEIQAHDQGFMLRDADKFQKILHSIHMCHFHVATDSELRNMLKKLNKQVVENLRPVESNTSSDFDDADWEHVDWGNAEDLPF